MLYLTFNEFHLNCESFKKETYLGISFTFQALLKLPTSPHPPRLPHPTQSPSRVTLQNKFPEVEFQGLAIYLTFGEILLHCPKGIRVPVSPVEAPSCPVQMVYVDPGQGCSSAGVRAPHSIYGSRALTFANCC